MKKLTGIIGLLLCITEVFADVYRWQESSGVVQYSQFKPKSDSHSISLPLSVTRIDSEFISQASTVEVISNSAKKVPASTQTKNKSKKKKKASSSRSVHLQRPSRELCEQAKKTLHAIESTLRAGYSNAQEGSLRHQKRQAEMNYFRRCVRRQ